MTHARTALAIGLAALLVLAAAPLAAQTTSGALTGTVLDDTGLPLPGATVTVTSPDLVRGSASAVTDASGAFRFPSLPPSVYAIEVSLQGFRSARREGVRLGLGQTLSVPFRLELPTVAAEAVVTAEAPVVSVVSNTVSSNVTADVIQRQPVGRSQSAVINITPGVKDGLAFGGTQNVSNAYSLDGVNVSDPAGTGQWILPNVDWLQEVQVSGLGADAEVGGFTGAAINLVTKSGGNELAGDVTAYYSDAGLNSSNSSDPALTPAEVDSSLDVAANLGGAFRKDLLWFFVSGNEVREDIRPQGAQNTVETSISRYLAKLTLQLGESNKVVGLLDYDGIDRERRGISEFTLESGSHRQDSPNWSYALSWDSMLSARSFLELKAAGFTGSDDRLPYGGPNRPGREDADSGYVWDNFRWTNLVDNSRLSVNAAWSLFADGLLAKGDTHRFKLGVGYETAKADELRTRNGGFTYYDDSYYCSSLAAYLANPACGAYSSDRGGEITMKSTNKAVNVFVQDSWQVSRLTVNAGVRYTRYEGGFRNGNESVYAPGDLFAPRIGVVWDVFGTAKTALKAHWGRYYEGLFSYLYDREESGAVFTPTTYWDYNPATGQYDIAAGGGSTNRATLDPGIKHPYMDQIVFSVEQQVGRDVLLGLDYARRDTTDIVAFANVVDDYDALVAPAGVFKDVNGNQVAKGNLPFYDLLSRPSNALLNPAEAYRQYDAVFLRAEKRYSNGWSARASVVWSENKGNTYAANGYTSEWTDRNGQTNADGLLPSHSQWEVKVSGTYDLPFGFMLGAYYQFYSGEYWTPYVQFRGLFRNDRSTAFLNERGSEQLPDRHLLDLKLSKRFSLGSRLAITAFADAFNVLNSDTELSVDSFLGTYRYNFRNHPAGSTFQARSAYRAVTAVERPREIRLGARFSF